MNELERLVDEQQRDDTYRVWSISIDAIPAGADIVQRRRRQTVTDPRHGTLACYVGLRCRCSKCRTASAAYARERRRRQSERLCVDGCGRTVSRRARCLSCAMRLVWAERKAAA